MKRIIVISIVLFMMLALLSTGVYAASESEANDTAKTADAISVNTDVSGVISRSSDVDWYKFSLPKDGYLTVDFRHELISSTSAYWSLYLYREDGVTGVCDYDQRWEMAGNANGATPQVGLKAGVYYLVVTKGPYNTSGVEYIFNVNYTETENTELEPNGNSKKATEIELNKDYVGSVAGNSDIDWYKLVLPEDGHVTVEFKHEIISSTSSFWSLYLYQADGVTGACDYDQRWEIAGNKNGATPQIGLKAGVYYLSVSRGPYNTSTVNYTINANYTETELTELEPNNNQKKATEIETNKNYSGSVAGNSDVDWYKLVLPEDGYISVDFKHELLSSTSGFWNFYLYQEDGITSIGNYSHKYQVLGNANLKTNQIGLKAGVYYIQVTRGDYNTSDVVYTVNVNFTQTEYTELEPNSSAKEATNIKVNKEYSGSVGNGSDTDWYKFTLPAAADVTINFKHEILSSTSNYWAVNLYKEDGVTVIKNFNVSGNENGSFAMGSMEAGTYFIMVTCDRYHTSNVTYTLSVTEKHDCKGSFTITKEPTCTQSGEQQKLCDVCGKMLETQTVAPTGHKSESWTVDIEPTCNSEGSKHATCSVCNETVTEKIAKLEHVFGNWETVKEPTCKVAGSEERTCSLCNHKEEKAIEKLEHRFGDWEVISGNVIIPPIVKEQECELCGFTETVNDWGYVWVTVIASITLVGLCIGVIAYIKAFRRP